MDFPANTAPAGYTCPKCEKGIFPNSNATDPVAIALRKVLSEASWARVGLGLPILIDNSSTSLTSFVDELSNSVVENHTVPQVVYQTPTTPTNSIPISVNNVNSYISPTIDSSSSTLSHVTSTRAKIHDIDGVQSNNSRQSLLDIDDDKYRNKSPMEFISRWLRFVIRILLLMIGKNDLLILFHFTDHIPLL